MVVTALDAVATMDGDRDGEDEEGMRGRTDD